LAATDQLGIFLLESGIEGQWDIGVDISAAYYLVHNLLIKTDTNVFANGSGNSGSGSDGVESNWVIDAHANAISSY
jgi:hypothetical protein